MYAGRNGQVYRNTGDGWQVFDRGWQDVKPPERGELIQGGEGLRGLSPEARDRLQQRMGAEAIAGLGGVGAAAKIRERAQENTSQRPTAKDRSSQRLTTRNTTPRRTSAQPPTASRQLPSTLNRDVQARYRGNQREISRRYYPQPIGGSYGNRSYGGGSFGGGGGGRSFGGGGRGGGRR
jgi:hypothetical protein